MEIILPAVDCDLLSNRLYELSSLLGELDAEKQHHGCLGGEWGYGQHFENDVFEMHPYYWGDCDVCDSPEYDDRPDNMLPKHDCPYTRPNFRHKASGLEVNWYKYIGRGMEANKNLPTKELRRIFRECEDSVEPVASGGATGDNT